MNVGFARGASQVYGYLDVAGKVSDYFGQGNVASTTYYVLRSGEYSSSAKPTAAPTTASSCKCPYGMRDWFIGENDTPGTIYNINRATLGNQWACPIIVPVGTSSTPVVIALSNLDNLLM